MLYQRERAGLAPTRIYGENVDYRPAVCGEMTYVLYDTQIYVID